MFDALRLGVMRTTFSIDNDVLMAAKALARQQKKSVGAVLSALARQGLRRPAASAERNGIILLDRGPEAPIVTLDIVNALRDEGA
jgi:hypothetical protein